VQVAGLLDKIYIVYGKACAWATIDLAGPINGLAKKKARRVEGHRGVCVGGYAGTTNI